MLEGNMELTNVSTQTVIAGNNVLFAETVVPGSKCIIHRPGSGLITLRGITKNQCKARFLVLFNGNIAVPTTGTAGEISVAISINGEPLIGAEAAVTPTVTDAYFNVSSMTYIDVPANTSLTVSVENTSTATINVGNANLIVTRVA